MSITMEDRGSGDAHLVTVHGEVDLRTAPELRQRLTHLVDAGTAEMVVDLRDVPFVDSSALSVFVTIHKRLSAAGGRLVLVCDEGPVRRVLGITGLSRVLIMHRSVDAAISA